MKARAFLALCLAASGTPAEEALHLEASREEGGLLRVRVKADLPQKTLIALTVDRCFEGRPPLPLDRYRLMLDANGRGESAYRMGEELAVPGAYRVRASVETRGEKHPAPAEVRLDEDLGKLPYLKAVLEEQGFLISAMSWTAGFLDDLGRMETLMAQDRKAGVEAWKIWRDNAVPELNRLIDRGTKQGRRFSPRVHDRFSGEFLFMGLLQLESRKFQAAQCDGEYRGTGFFRDRDPQGSRALEPYRALLLTEAAAYRLQILKALAKAAKEGRRADFDGMLTLWSSDPEAFEDPRWKSLMELAPLFQTWLDAPPETKDAARQALDSKYADLEAAFKPR